MKQEKVNNLCGSRLKSARRKKELTQAQLAELLDVDPKYISALENDRRTMSTTLAITCEKILGVRHEYLLGYDNYISNIEKFSSHRYDSTEMLDYITILESHDYVISSPFGCDGDTALLSFLSHLSETLVIDHGDQHYKCSTDQFHTFLQNTHDALENLRQVLVKQFLASCENISPEQHQDEMKKMKDRFDSSYGQAGATWLKEQSKVDNFKFDAVDNKAYGDSIKSILEIAFADSVAPSKVQELLNSLKDGIDWETEKERAKGKK